MGVKKKVVISGYYGFDNTGDEAVLYSILKALRQENKGVPLDITVLSNQPEQTSMQYRVKAINRWDMKQVYKAIRECELLISGGGSLLQDVTSNKTVPYYLGIIKMAQWHKKEVVIYSQGYGPVNKAYNKFLVKRVLNKVNHIFVRDRNAKEALLEIGIKNPPIVVTTDPVMGMKASKIAKLKIKGYLKERKEGRPRVGIYLRSWKDDINFRWQIADICSELAERDIDLYCIPMQRPEDHRFLNFLEEEYPLSPTVTRIDEKLDVKEVFALTGEMDVVIGMRLHALIMATAQGIPVVGLSYDPKVDDFMASIQNKNCFDVENFDPFELTDAVLDLLEHIEKEKEAVEHKKQLLIDTVYQPAKLVNKILT